MSDQTEAVEASEDILEGAVEVVEGVAQMARGFSGLALSGAFAVGVGVGGAAAYFLTKRALDAKYRKIADDEIAEMSEHFRAKSIALENSVDKPRLEELIQEQGYSTEQSDAPMAVTPPSAVVDRAQEVAESDDKVEDQPPKTDTVEKRVEPEVRNIFKDSQVDYRWDASRERARRSPLKPYVIHRDEREEYELYDDITLTYYEDDDVVCDESDAVFDHRERDEMIGEENLSRFGHGSGDSNLVYIRNDQMETVFTVVRSPNSYAEEVHGFDPAPDDSELRHSYRKQQKWASEDE